MDSLNVAYFEQKHAELSQRIADACARSGRDASEVRLLAVSKTVDTPAVVAAARAGFTNFGENRPQELKRKMSILAAEPAFEGAHFEMIGNLQTNKINQVLDLVSCIHSVSSLHLAEAISKRAVQKNMVMDCLLELNVSGEFSKSGMSEAEVLSQLDDLLQLPGLAIKGCMTMAPAHDLAAARSCFSRLRELRDTLRERSGLELAELSCGMSDDFEIAVEEGSTLLRLGRVLFDPNYC